MNDLRFQDLIYVPVYHTYGFDKKVLTCIIRSHCGDSIIAVDVFGYEHKFTDNELGTKFYITKKDAEENL